MNNDSYGIAKGITDGIGGCLAILLLIVILFGGLPQLVTYIQDHPANPCDDPWLEHPSGFRGVPVSFGKLKNQQQVRACYENLKKQ